MQRLDIVATPKYRTEATSDLTETIVSHLRYSVGTDPDRAQPHDWFLATAFTLRNHIVDRWIESERRTHGRKHVYYLSIEFLIGRMLIDGLCNLDLIKPVNAALTSLGVDLSKLRALEPDPGLGNGGLGRLAACFMESMATRGVAAFGYGIRYEHGLFRQQLRDGWQHELPDDWLAAGNPWEFERPAKIFPVRFGGVVEYVGGSPETPRAIWYPEEVVNAVAYDTPIVGWRGRNVTTLRLWSARATDAYHHFLPYQHDYVGAVLARERAEQISGVLYPSTDTVAGQELRLRQEFFFTSASLQDLIQRHIAQYADIASLPDHTAIQMNDTHPAIAVAELMRILVDDHDVEWPEAWRITTATLNYTNHTLLPEALESWPVDLMNRLLPRHMQIIFIINWLHLRHVAERDGSAENLSANSLVDEKGERRVRMGHLAFLGSAKVNGVSELHTDLMQKSIFRDLDASYPGRIVNKTNGITFRRWLFQANPGLTELLTDTIGKRFLDDPDELRHLERHTGDGEFLIRLAKVRRANKFNLCNIIRDQTGVRPDPSALFDVHIKRVHEYKRQLLNILETVALFHAIHADPMKSWTPRVKIFAGKAAATYTQAKLIIKLANDVARVVNNDPVVGSRLKVAWLPNYSVSLAEAIIPAADLSEQISTAGLEASGTGNMKLALNGALTIGTLDGANIEICDAVAPENIFIFGLKANEVAARKHDGFTGRDAMDASSILKEAIGSIADGVFSPDDPGRFKPIVDKLLGHDEFMTAADFEAYWTMQREIDARWQDTNGWWRSSLFNTARMSWFSSDRSIGEYAEEIWRVPLDAPRFHGDFAMQALFIGQTYIDVTFLADHIPTGDDKSVASEYAVSFGGNAVTAAFCCAKLNVTTDLIATGADDWLGRMFLDMAAKYGVGLHIRKVKKSSLSFVMPRGDKRAIVRCRDDHYLHPFPMLDITGCRALHVDGHQPDAAMHYARQCRDMGILTSLDGGAVRSNTHELLEFIDVAVVAERFCEQMNLSPEATLDYLQARGCKVCAVTLGGKGILWREQDGPTQSEFSLPVPASRIVDTNGAGDVFHGAYIYSLLNDPEKSWGEHFAFAKAASAFKIQHLGNEAGLPTLADIAATQSEFSLKTLAGSQV